MRTRAATAVSVSLLLIGSALLAAAPQTPAAAATQSGRTYPLWDGKETQADYARRAGIKDVELTLALDTNISVKLILIPAGTFTMGRAGPGNMPNSPYPAHEVTISKPFYMAVTEVTQGQFAALMDSDAVRSACFKRAVDMDASTAIAIAKGGTIDYKPEPSLPVDQVNWNEATAFCAKLSEKTGRHATLPTEAQWEYACRAGTTTAYFSGEDPSSLRDCAWYVGNDKEHPAGAMPVGLKKPNLWGLYDMAGNVSEWTLDFTPVYPADPVVDTQAPSGGRGYQNRGFRGCYWGGFNPSEMRDMYRSDDRVCIYPDYKLDVSGRWKGRMPGAGFRVAVLLEAPAAVATTTSAPGLRMASAQAWRADQAPFPILGWGMPPEAKMTDAAFADMAGAGINLAIAGPVGTYWQNKKILDLCQKHGLKYAVADEGFWAGEVRGPGFPGPWPKEQWGRRAKEIAEDYAEHPAFWGYFLMDEPSHANFYALGDMVARLKEADAAHPECINLFPTYASGLGIATYEDYVARFIKLVKPRVLSYDNYPVQKEGVRADFYDNMALIRRHALEANIPFWGFALTHAHGGYPAPAEGEIAWEIYSLLAYGAKGIEYFLYWPNTGEGIVDANGNKGRVYEPVRKLNAEVKAMGPTLLRLTSTAVYHSAGDLPKGCVALDANNGLIAAMDGASVILGLFKDTNGSRYALIVNKDFKAACKVTVTLAAAVEKVERFDCATGTWAPLAANAGTIEASLEAGRGKLLRLSLSHAQEKD